MITSLIFDFDGVLGLSRALAWSAGCRIISVFGCQPQVASIRDYKHAFGRESQELAAGKDGAETLREMHRLVMRSQGHQIPRNDGLLKVISSLACPVGIITAGYAETARRCLGSDSTLFRFIRGCEDGTKTELLRSCRQEEFASPMYLGDTVRDIRRCQKVGIPVCATAWLHAYDESDDLNAANPDWFIRDQNELTNLLSSHQLFSTHEN